MDKSARTLITVLIVLILALGGYMIYDSQQDDIDIDLPDIEINE